MFELNAIMNEPLSFFEQFDFVWTWPRPMPPRIILTQYPDSVLPVQHYFPLKVVVHGSTGRWIGPFMDQDRFPRQDPVILGIPHKMGEKEKQHRCYWTDKMFHDLILNLFWFLLAIRGLPVLIVQCDFSFLKPGFQFYFIVSGDKGYFTGNR